MVSYPLSAAMNKAESPPYTNNKQTQIIITNRNYNNDQTNKQTIDNEKKKSNEMIPKTNPKIWFI